MTFITMRRFQQTFLKPFSGTDPRQIPAAGSTVSVFRQGATVRTTTIIYEGITTTVDVYSPGALVVGDTVQIGTDGNQYFQVEAVDPVAATVGISSAVPGQVVFQAGQRMVPVNAPPALFSDAAGTVAITGAAALDANGNCGFYCRAARFDYILAGGGITPRLYLDGEGGWVRGGAAWLNAKDYPGLQEAVDATPTGGTLLIPAGEYRVPSGGLILSRTMALRGEPGTRLVAYSLAANQPVIKLVPGGQVLQDVELHDLYLTNPSVPSQVYSGNHGLVCDVPTDGSKVTGLLLDRVRVYNMGDDGIKLTAYGTSDSYFVFVTCRRLDMTLNKGYGFRVQWATVVTLEDSFFNANDYSGFYAITSEVALRGCAFESNCKVAIQSPQYGGQARVDTCLQARLDACRFEAFTGSGQNPKRALAIQNSPCCSVTNCFFGNAELSTDPAARGIYCSYGTSPPVGPGVQASVFYGNVFQNVKTSLEIDGVTNPALDCIVFPQFATEGSGAMILPLDTASNGLLVLGGRPAPTGGVQALPLGARGLMAPVVLSATPGSVQTPEVGRVIYDPQVARLRYWDGSQWRQVQTIP